MSELLKLAERVDWDKEIPINDSSGYPVAWVDYDDVDRDDAEKLAQMFAAAPDYAAAAERLLAVFDQQRMTAAERIIAGVSDAGLRTEGNAAIEALRAAHVTATGQ